MIFKKKTSIDTIVKLTNVLSQYQDLRKSSRSAEESANYRRLILKTQNTLLAMGKKHA